MNVVYQHPPNQTTPFSLLPVVMSFEQARDDGLCLRYPENLGSHASINYETAVNMLTKGMQLSHQVPYTWGWIDRPSGIFTQPFV
jgi:hypothetical protein